MYCRILFMYLYFVFWKAGVTRVSNLNHLDSVLFPFYYWQDMS